MQLFVLLYFGVAFCPAQHCTVVRGSRDFGREDISQGLRCSIRQKKSKIKKRGFMDDTCDGSHVASLCCSSCSKKVQAGADTFSQHGQCRSWPPPAWSPPRLPFAAANIALPYRPRCCGIGPYSHRTKSSSPATSPRYRSAHSRANFMGILQKRVSGEKRWRQAEA